MKYTYCQAGLDLPPAGPAGKKAFTRVELVVVIAVVGILSLVLRTTMASSQDGGERNVCMHNLKRLVTAAMMYALDNQDQMSYPNWGSSTVDGKGWLYTPVNGNPPDLGANPYKTNVLAAYQGGALWPFVKDMWTYRCPLDKTNAIYNPYSAGRANKLSTYIMNGAVCGYGTQSEKKPNTYKLVQFNPNAFMMWEPDENLMNNGSVIGSFAYNDASSYPDVGEGVGRRHVTGAPLATFNGQVEWTSFELFQHEQLDARAPTRLWCNPGTANGR